MRRRIAEGLGKREVVRWLKRYVAREVYLVIQKPDQISVRRLDNYSNCPESQEEWMATSVLGSRQGER